MDGYSDACRHLVTDYRGRAWELLGPSDWGASADNTLDVGA